MEDDHLSLETMAKWLAGRLEHESVLERIVPHLLERCPVCRECYEQIRQLKREAGHEDEEVGVFEWREAPELLQGLEDLPIVEQHRKVREDETFHTWGFCQLLLQRSRESVSEEPARALTRAELAVEGSRHLGPSYDPDWVFDLRARAWAGLGNARRVLGELWSAEAAFREAEDCLALSTSGNTWAKAEVLDLKSSLRQDQGRFEESLDLVEHAYRFYREEDDARGAAKVLLNKSKLFREMGDLDRAIATLRETAPEIDAAGDSRLSATARYNLLCCLDEAGHHQEAWDLLPEVRDRFRDSARPLDHVRLRWAEGGLAHELGRLEEAEAAYREVGEEFLRQAMFHNAALVGLDLARLLLEQGRSEELKALAVELVTAFEARGIQREATAALVLFQRACDEKRLTVEMVTRVAGLLRKAEEGGG